MNSDHNRRIGIFSKYAEYKKQYETGLELTSRGFSLVCEYFERKDKKPCDIFIVDDNNPGELESVLEKMIKLPNGSKFALMSINAQHWSAMLCVRRNEKNYIIHMDSLGAGKYGSHLQDIIKNNQDLRDDTILLANINGIQFNMSDCGNFSIRFCRKMISHPDFLHYLESEKFVLTQDDVVSYKLSEAKRKGETISQGDIEQLVKSDYKSNQFMYVLPPELYALVQRDKYIEYYRTSWGDKIPEIIQYRHQTKDGPLTLEQMVARSHRKVNLTVDQQKQSFENKITNHTVLYFRDKYLKIAVDELSTQHTKEELYVISERHFAKNISLNRLAETASHNNLSTPEVLPELVTEAIEVTESEHKSLVDAERQHYSQLILEKQLSSLHNHDEGPKKTTKNTKK